MDQTNEKSGWGRVFRLTAFLLAGILVFHLIAPAANALAGEKTKLAEPTQMPEETAAQTTAADHLAMAETAIAAQDYETALNHLKTAGTLADSQTGGSLTPQILVKTVSIQILQEKYEEAITAIEEFKAAGSAGDDTLMGILEFLLGGCYVQTAEHEKAVSAYQNAIKLGYDQGTCLEQIILSCFELGEYETLAMAGQQLLEMENVILSDPALVYQELGISHVYLGSFEKALGFLEQANALLEEPQANGYYRGICLISLERPQEAIEAFTASIEEGALLSYCYYNRGVCYLDLQDYEQTKADLEKTIEIGDDPSLTEAAEDVLEQLKQAGL